MLNIQKKEKYETEREEIMLFEETVFFGVPIRKFQFQREEITPLLDEYQEKRDSIIKRSEAYNNDTLGSEQDSTEYATDYRHPVTLHEYEKLMMILKNYFENNKYTFTLVNYWTAIYNKKGYHKQHFHNSGSLAAPQVNNCSSVLYLNSIGGTEFYAPHAMSYVSNVWVKSEVGLLVIFPAGLLHSAPTTNSKNERVVISSNLGIYKR